MSDVECAREIRWCVSVIHHAALVAKRKYNRWQREPLTLNNISEDGSEFIVQVPCTDSGQAFEDRELELLLQTLPKTQYLVMHDLYVNCLPQKQIADHLHISQQQVSRLRTKALQNLRKEMTN